MTNKHASVRTTTMGIALAMALGAPGLPARIACADEVAVPDAEAETVEMSAQDEPAPTPKKTSDAPADDEGSPSVDDELAPSDDAESYGLWVGDSEVTDALLSGEGWEFNKESNILKLTNYTAKPKWHGDAAIHYTGTRALRIEVTGTCVLEGPAAKDSDKYGFKAEDGYGILAEGGTITIAMEDGNKLEVLGGKAAVKGALHIDKGLYLEEGESRETAAEVSGFSPTLLERTRTYDGTEPKFVRVAHKTRHSVTVFYDSVGGVVTASHWFEFPETVVTITIEPLTGYELDTLTATTGGQTTVPLTDVDDTHKTFAMPNADVAIHASFKYRQYDVFVEQTSHGTVRVDKTKATGLETVTLTITPDDGYEAGTPTITSDDRTFNDFPIPAHKFVMPFSDVTVTVPFVAKKPSTTPTPRTITPSDDDDTSVSTTYTTTRPSTLAKTADPTTTADAVATAVAGTAGLAVGLRRRRGHDA